MKRDAGMIIICTSVDYQNKAEDMARMLVKEKLAACVQISAQGTSFYQWEGKVCQEKEYYLTIKTTINKQDDVVAWLKSNHSYDTPEIIILNAKASHDYHDWLSNSLEN